MSHRIAEFSTLGWRTRRVLAYAHAGETMRLTGLPHVGRYPEAVVKRSGERIEVRFGGRGDEQLMNVPVKYLGGADEEASELRLLAQLQQIGYEVRREEPG